MTARSERPIRRLISWVRPPIRPLTDSRSERVFVEAGSMAYSAVTQPSPDPLRQRGTPTDADAAHSTLVQPVSGDRDRAELVVLAAVFASHAMEPSDGRPTRARGRGSSDARPGGARGSSVGSTAARGSAGGTSSPRSGRA